MNETLCVYHVVYHFVYKIMKNISTLFYKLFLSYNFPRRGKVNVKNILYVSQHNIVRIYLHKKLAK